MQAKEIFLQALDIEDGSQRTAFVDEKCQNDAALRRKVEALLAANDAPASYLEQPAARFDVTATTFGKSSAGGVSDSSHHGRWLARFRTRTFAASMTSGKSTANISFLWNTSMAKTLKLCCIASVDCRKTKEFRLLASYARDCLPHMPRGFCTAILNLPTS